MNCKNVYLLTQDYPREDLVQGSVPALDAHVGNPGLNYNISV